MTDQSGQNLTTDSKAHSASDFHGWSRDELARLAASQRGRIDDLRARIAMLERENAELGRRHLERFGLRPEDVR